MLLADIERFLILGILLLALLLGLRKSADRVVAFLPKDLSQVLKGIACVLVLMGHYESSIYISMDYPLGLGKIIRYTTANIALVWFMFISGYGLSFSKIREGDIAKSCVKRLWHIYYPLLFVTIISSVVYFVIGSYSTIELPDDYRIPVDLQHFTTFNFYSLIFLFGLDNWYVVCIAMFYSLFYLSTFINIKYGIDRTIVLLVLLVVYYIIAFFIAGTQNAHYYRLTWAFFLGNLVSRGSTLCIWKRVMFVMISLVGFYFESSVMIFSFVLSISLLFLLSYITHGKGFYLGGIGGGTLMFLGRISYPFYLCHLSICWVLLCYIHVYYELVLLLFTIIVSYIIQKLVELVESRSA